MTRDFLLDEIDLISLAYAAPRVADGWPRFVRALRSTLGLAGVALLRRDLATGDVTTLAFDGLTQAEVQASCVSLVAATGQMSGQEPGQSTGQSTGASTGPGETPAGLGEDFVQFVALKVDAADPGAPARDLRVMRCGAAWWAALALVPAPAGNAADLVDRLAAHLPRILAMAPTLAPKGDDDGLVTALMEARRKPAAILDGEGRVLRRNRRATTLEQSGRIRLDAGARVHLVDAIEAREFATKIAEVTALPTPAVRFVRVHDAGDAGTFFLEIARLADAADAMGPRVLLTVHGERGSDCIDPAVSEEALGLTPTETDIATAIARGETVNAYAKRNGGKPLTVRWHLDNVREKAGVADQKELVAFIWNLHTG